MPSGKDAKVELEVTSFSPEEIELIRDALILSERTLNDIARDYRLKAEKSRKEKRYMNAMDERNHAVLCERQASAMEKLRTRLASQREAQSDTPAEIPE